MRLSRLRENFSRVIAILLPIIGSLIAGSLLIILAGERVIPTYINLFNAGFSCRDGAGRCALLTTLQFATPLIFSGLSAVVALRAGFFSIGQAGQMLFGAAAAAWVGAWIWLPNAIHPIAALLAAAIFGALWGIVPALLREFVGVNEIISTLLLNSIAGFIIGQVRIPRLEDSVHLMPLVPNTKITAGLILAVTMAFLIYFLLWKSKKGLEIRNSAQAPRFSAYGGIKRHQPVIIAMAISGALAGLAGAVEVLGVHYRFVSSFSAVNDFDGLIVAFTGFLHPIGALVISVLLGGLRSGAIVGLQIRSGIPRELGGALIALMLIFASMHSFYRTNGKNKREINK